VTAISWWERLKIAIQHIIPQHLLSGWMHALTRCRWKPFKNLLIRFVIHQYKVDMTLAQQPDYRAYTCFNDFFTRQLKQEARPVVSGDKQVICPVDGAVSQIGNINQTRIFQAKGHQFDLAGLLSGETQLVDSFRNGTFATLYLSPRDYHRVHMPLDGLLLKMLYVPGRLFSVNRATTSSVASLFSRNERVISIFQTCSGLMAVILVGAIFVGSMETVWAGQITPAPERKRTQWDYQGTGREIRLAKGEEMGRFNMGSTVILLFEPGMVEWLTELQADTVVVMGQVIAKIASGK